MKLSVPVALAALVASPAAAHVGDHDAATPAAHFVLEPAHMLPVLVLAAVVVGGLVWRERRRAAVRRRKSES
jgi:hypothetical protein